MDKHGFFVEISPSELQVQKYLDLVQDPGAGSISTFIGVTRNEFQGKQVLYLEYEAYKPMAEKKLKELCKQIHDKWPISKIAIAHRTGVVEVGQSSVVIAISSPHRAEGLEATRWAIDELKATVPIWKREFFQDGSIWKENVEFTRQQV